MSASSFLTGVQTAPLDLLVQALLAAAAALYLIGTHRLRRRGRRWSVGSRLAFLGGLLSVWVAVASGLAAQEDTNVTVHVVQHLLLMMVAPPLLVLGRPLVLGAQAAGRRGQSVLVRAVNGPVLQWVSHPLAGWVLYLGSMTVMLGNRGVYDFLVAHPIVHDAGHGWLVLVGFLYWEPLLGVGRLSDPVRVMSVLANMPFEVLVGLWLRYQITPIDRINTLADTQRAGESFVVGATMISTLWLAAIVVRWAARALREEQRAARAPAGSGWTTPWWVHPAGLTSGAAVDPSGGRPGVPPAVPNGTSEGP